MLSNWPIRVKFLVGLGLLLLLVCVLSGSGFYTTSAYRSLVRDLRERAAELPLAADLSGQVADLRITLSLLEGLRESPFPDAEGDEIPTRVLWVREQFRTELDQVEETLSSYRTQLEDKVRNGSPMADNQREWKTTDEINDALVRIHEVNCDEDWVLDDVGKVDQLKFELEHLQQLATELPSHLHRKLRGFREEVRSKYHALFVGTGVTSILAGLIVVLFLKLFYRWIFRPLEILIRGSRRVAAGQFNFRIRLESDDEMAELAGAMNAMTDRFRAIRDDLDHQVRERTKQVVRSEQLASVGFLAAGVAHEINNPLASIAISAESLESRFGEMLDENDPQHAVIDRYLRMIQSEAFRCKGITEKLLDFSRIGPTHRQNTELTDLVQGVIDMVGHLGKYQKKHVEFEPTEAIIAPVNPQEIKQVVLNLLCNALDSLDEGGTVRMSIARHDGCAELTLLDNGCGMEPHVLKHVFEPFFTRRKSGKAPDSGCRSPIESSPTTAERFTPKVPGQDRAPRSTCGCRSSKKRRRTQISTKPHNRLKLLFADDEKSLQELMRLELPRMGHEVTVCPDGLTAVAALERNTYDCILVDLDMPGLGGIEVIARAKKLAPDTEAVVLTGKSSLETAVEALRQGTFDYLTKPCRLVEVKAVLARVAEKRELTNKYRALKQRLHRIEGTADLVGTSAGMENVRSMIAKVAATNSTVLILGETGTGKELVARALHNQSLRAEMPFVPINCGALPENLIESELFGHRKGSFTGAEEHRVGLFEVAGGGTLFLDEIGELPKGMQAKLLRFLESGEIRRVGENESFCCDVRVVCATHRQLDEMVEEGLFREDLWFRVNTFEIQLPPLRERIEDIADLASHMAARFRQNLPPDRDVLTPEALAELTEHSWPGNVRELANVIEHAMILCDRLPISTERLPHRFASRRIRRLRPYRPGHTLRDIETQVIHEALERHGGSKPKAADELGISLKTLYNKINQAAALEKSA